MQKYMIALIVIFLLWMNYSCNDSSSDPFGGMILSDLMMPIDGVSKRATSTRLGEDGKPADHNADNSRVMPGEIKVILEAEGPGIITHMWFTFLGPGRHVWAVDGSATHQEMLLRIYYDGCDQPAVEAPFGDFFANCFGKRSEVISLPVIVEGADSYNSFWPMPFKKSIRVEVVNQSQAKNINLLYYNIDWIKKDKLPKNTPYFYARYRQEYPTQKGKDYLILETEGKGHYVGTVMAVRSRSPQWFGEGDEKIYIDGETEPSIWGTGTEDYFLSAWGLKSNVNTPYFGTVYYDHSNIGGHTSAYRWHIADPVVFGKSIKVTIEHGGWISADENKERRTHSWNEREDDFATVAYWYQTGTPAYAGEIPPAEERILPNIDIIFPAKGTIGTKSFKNGRAQVQMNLDFYMNGQLLFEPSGPQSSVNIPFTVEQKEPRRLLLSLTRAPDYGIWQAYLNGIRIGRPINLYNDKVQPWEQHLLDFWPDPGNYNLELRSLGKDNRSSGESLGIEALRLRERRPRVKDFAFNKGNDWRVEQLLY
jgi:hypothetical protein